MYFTDPFFSFFYITTECDVVIWWISERCDMLLPWFPSVKYQVSIEERRRGKSTTLKWQDVPAGRGRWLFSLLCTGETTSALCQFWAPWFEKDETCKTPWGWLRTWRVWHISRGWESLEKTRCSGVAISVRIGVNKVGCSNFPNKPKLLSDILRWHLGSSEKTERLIGPFWKLFPLKCFQRSNFSSLHRFSHVRSQVLSPLLRDAILSCISSLTELNEFHSSE